MEPQKHFQKQPRVFTLDEMKSQSENIRKNDTLKIKNLDKSVKDIGSKVLKEPSEVLKGIKDGVEKFVIEDTDFHFTPPKLNLDKFKNQNLIHGEAFQYIDTAMAEARDAAHPKALKSTAPLTKVMMLPKNERETALKEVLNDFRKDIKTLQQHKKTDKGLGMLAEYINKAGGIDNFVDNILSSDKDKDLDKKGGEQKNLPKTKDHRLLQKTHKDAQHETKPLMSGKVNAKSEPKQNLNLNNR